MRRYGFLWRSAFTVPAISVESWNRRMAAMPEAPAERHAAKFSGVIPPMARTGILTEAQTSARRSRPCGASIPRFGWRREDGAEENIIGASGGSRPGGCQRVTRNAKQKIGLERLGRLRRHDQTPSVFYTQGVLAEMNAGGSFGESHVEAIIDENTCDDGRLVPLLRNTA